MDHGLIGRIGKNSETPQEFIVYDSEEETFYDGDGGEQFEMSCVDNDGTLQLYVDYSDLMMVYCLEYR